MASPGGWMDGRMRMDGWRWTDDGWRMEAGTQGTGKKLVRVTFRVTWLHMHRRSTRDLTAVTGTRFAADNPTWHGHLGHSPDHPISVRLTGAPLMFPSGIYLAGGMVTFMVTRALSRLSTAYYRTMDRHAEGVLLRCFFNYRLISGVSLRQPCGT